MRFNFKKVAAVLVGTALMGATLGLAAASTYPSPFVQNGNANVAVVYGSSAAPTDIAAVADITSNLQAALAQQTATVSNSGSGSTASGSNFVYLNLPSSLQHVGQTLGTVWGVPVTSTNLPGLLANGVFTSANGNTYQYTQQVTMSNNITLQQFDNGNYVQNTPVTGYWIPSGQPILNYTLQFQTNPNFDSTMTGQTINLMGVNYYVLGEYNATGASASSQTITLLNSANTQTITQGTPITVNLNGNSYKIDISYENGNYVNLNVNGQVTNSLYIGSTYQLDNNGDVLGVQTLEPAAISGQTNQVVISIGSGKLQLSSGGQPVQINGNSVTGVNSYITNDSSGRLSNIVVQWIAPNDTFVTNTASYGSANATMPGFNSLQLSTTGMYYPLIENTTVTNDGNNAVQLQSVDADGPVAFDILGLNTNNNGNYSVIGNPSGESGSQGTLDTTPYNNVTYNYANNSFIIVSKNDGRNFESHVISIPSYSLSGSYAQAQVQVLGSNGSEITVTNQTGSTLTVGNIVLGITNIGYSGQNITLNTNGNPAVNFDQFYTKSGMEIVLPTTSGNSATNIGYLNLSTANPTYNLQFFEADKNGNIGTNATATGGGNFTIQLGTTGSGSSVQTTVSNVIVNGTGSSGGSALNELGSSNVYVGRTYSPLTSKVWWNEGPTQHTATIEYHGEESYSHLILAAPGVSISSSGVTSSGGSVKVLGSVSVADSSISSVSTDNLIVVGGSCVNTAAATLLGSTTPLCGSDWQTATNVGAGQFLIQTFNSPWSSGQFATLVAGYNAIDTTNAVQYLLTQSGVSTTAGSKYIGTSSTQATLSTVSTMTNSSA